MAWLRRLGQGTLTTARVVVMVSTLPLFVFASMIQSYRERNDGDDDPDGEDPPASTSA